MTSTRKNLFKAVALVAAGLMAASLAPGPVQAGDWSFSFHVPFHRCRPYYGYGWAPRHRHYDYYPVYNPVVERDVYEDGHYHWNGTAHSDTLVEDRHASYYSPGRNEAITRPRTTVNRSYGPGFNQERERTSWIGADGRPHSTTITRTNTRDFWGNTHTDTHVSLKNRQGSSERGDRKPPATVSGKTPKEPRQSKVQNKAPAKNKRK